MHPAAGFTFRTPFLHPLEIVAAWEESGYRGGFEIGPYFVPSNSTEHKETVQVWVPLAGLGSGSYTRSLPPKPCSFQVICAHWKNSHYTLWG